MNRIVLSLGITLTLFACTLGAQAPHQATIDSGVLLRIVTPTNLTMGRLVAGFRPGDTEVRICHYPAPPCVGALDAGVRTVQINGVTLLQRQKGNHALTGAAIGGTIGMVFGALLSSFAAGVGECSDCSHVSIFGVLAAAGIPAGMGALFGSASPRWETVH